MVQFGDVVRMFLGLELRDGREGEREEELRVWVGLPGVEDGGVDGFGACLMLEVEGSQSLNSWMGFSEVWQVVFCQIGFLQT